MTCLSPQRAALLIDAHPGLAQRPVADDLAATGKRRIVRLGDARTRRSGLCRAINHGLTGDELAAAVGARR